MRARSLEIPCLDLCLLLGLSVFGCLVPSGCADSSPVSSGVTVRDSAGIPIVTTADPAWESEGEAWSVSAEPIVEIGQIEGDDAYLFSRLVDAELGQDHEVWVADGGINAIRVYDSLGMHLRTLGGEGEGPGEFTVLQGLERGTDFILAYQGGLRSVAVFGLSGELRFTSSPPAHAGLESPYFVGAVEDEAGVWGIIRSYPQGSPDREGLYEQRAPVYAALLSPGPGRGDSIREYGVFPAVRYVNIPGQGEAPYWQKYGPELVLATSRTSLFLSWTVEYGITQLAAGGDMRRIIRREWEPIPVSETDREAFESSLLTFPEGRPPPPQVVEFHRRIVEAMVLPDTHPPLDRLLLDAAGNLWVQRYEANREVVGVNYPPVPARSTVWDVFDPEGRWLGSLSLPGQFLLTAAGLDRIVGLWVGDFDVQYVRVYRLARARP